MNLLKKEKRILLKETKKLLDDDKITEDNEKLELIKTLLSDLSKLVGDCILRTTLNTLTAEIEHPERKKLNS